MWITWKKNINLRISVSKLAIADEAYYSKGSKKGKKKRRTANKTNEIKNKVNSYKICFHTENR